MKNKSYNIKSKIIYLVLLLFGFGFIYNFFRYRELLLLVAVVVISQIVILFFSRQHLVIITQCIACALLILFIFGYFMYKEVETTYDSYLEIKKTEGLTNNISNDQNKLLLYQWQEKKSENNQILSMIVLGDIHFPFSKPMNAVLDLVNQAETVDFVLCPGDLIDNSSYSNMYLFKKWMMKYKFPVLFVPGDHESVLHYKKLVKNENWKIIYEKKFVIFGINISRRNDQDVESALKYLNEELPKHKNQNKIIMFHFPMNSKLVDKFRWAPQYKKLNDIFKREGVKLVLMGHEHTNKLWVRDGITYYICSGIADKNSTRSTVNSFANIEISTEGEILIQTINVNQYGTCKIQNEFNF